jgi:tRNA-binding protein
MIHLILILDSMKQKPTIDWSDFEKVDMRLGTVISCEIFPEARKPAYKMNIDFGDEIGVRKSSAQITDHYQPEEMIGKQVIAVVNFAPKQIGPFMSECLVLGCYAADGSVILIRADQAMVNGSILG